MLRIATEQDIPLIVQMAMKFAQTTNYPVEEDSVRILAERMVNPADPSTIVFLHGEDGMIAATANKFIFGESFIATEVAWWVEPDKRLSSVGKELLDAVEAWAKKIGCSRITMISLDDSVGKYYEKRGYSLVERAYMKELQ